jgi:hypothetical protein
VQVVEIYDGKRLRRLTDFLDLSAAAVLVRSSYLPGAPWGPEPRARYLVVVDRELALLVVFHGYGMGPLSQAAGGRR